MASSITLPLVAMVIFLLASHAYVKETLAAGECGKTPLNVAAASLSPCAGAAQSAKVKVPPACCSRIQTLLTNSPKCLCAVFLSPLVKQAGINLAIAITVPKRCNIKNRPAGKKCGTSNIKKRLQIYCMKNMFSREKKNLSEVVFVESSW